MPKFKVGDMVGYYARADGAKVGPFRVTEHICEEVWFSDGSWMPADRLFLWGSVPDSSPAPVPETAAAWNYAEADRLEQAARSAITAYNAYIEQKPEKLYIPMYLPD